MNSLRRALDIFLPSQCLLCGDGAGLIRNLCEGCVRALPRNEICCPVCAAPSSRSLACPSCLRHPPPFTHTHSPFLYQGAVRHLVALAKFHGDLSAAAALGGLLAAALTDTLCEVPDCVVPIPLHRARLRARGFNQAAEIAAPIARRLSRPLGLRGYARARETPPQTELSRPAERIRNVKGAFTIAGILQGATHVAIVDDVMTTGATAAEFARTLIRSGVTRVDVWTVARTV